nr:exosortase F system-associated protein [uncultured Flavobacterium sp.]
MIGVFLLVLLLACVRLFEKHLFYDPFLEFFKGEFQNMQLPLYNTAQLFLGLLFRYFLNSGLSVAIIYIVFKDVQLVKVVSLLYAVFFVFLIAVFFWVLNFSEKPDYMVLFYVRRFLIQPIFLVLFLPAFYYQKKNSA